MPHCRRPGLDPILGAIAIGITLRPANVTMLSIDQKALSKTAAHALRHEPWLYGLELDDDGWVEVEHLIAALRIVRKDWSGVDASVVAAMVASSPKNRYEMDDRRIRARYGHSTPKRVDRRAEEPPQLLFHGTSPAVVAQILMQGD